MRALGVPQLKAPSGSRVTPLNATTQASAAAANINFVSGLLCEFPDVVNSGKLLPVPVHDVEHHIKTSGPLMASRFCRLDGAKLEATRREFKAMECEGIIQRSTTPWASPLHVVPKKDGFWRPCGVSGKLKFNFQRGRKIYKVGTLKGQCHHKCVLFRPSDIQNRQKLEDGNWFKIFLCLRWNNINF